MAPTGEQPGDRSLQRLVEAISKAAAGEAAAAPARPTERQTRATESSAGELSSVGAAPESHSDRLDLGLRELGLQDSMSRDESQLNHRQRDQARDLTTDDLEFKLATEVNLAFSQSAPPAATSDHGVSSLVESVLARQERSLEPEASEAAAANEHTHSEHSQDVLRIIEAFHREQAKIQGVAPDVDSSSTALDAPSPEIGGEQAAATAQPSDRLDFAIEEQRPNQEAQAEFHESGYADFSSTDALYEAPTTVSSPSADAADRLIDPLDHISRLDESPQRDSAEPAPLDPHAQSRKQDQSLTRGLFEQVERQDWAGLAEDCEQIMSQPETIAPSQLSLATALWVRAQLKLGDLPASIATAALETELLQSRRLQEFGDQELRLAAAQSFLEAAEALEKTGDFGGCTQFFERACAENIALEREFLKFLERRTSILKATLGRAGNSHRESTELKSALQAVEKRIEALTRKAADREAAPGLRASGQPASGLAMQARPRQGSEAGLSAAAIDRPAQRSSPHRVSILLTALILAILVGSWIAQREELYLDEDAQIAMLRAKGTAQSPELRTPSPQRAQLASGLDALLYDIAGPATPAATAIPAHDSGAAHRVGSQDSVGSQSNERRAPEPEPVAAVVRVSRDSESKRVAKEIIDTRGPIEGAEVREELARAEARRKQSEQEYARLWEKNPKQPEAKASDWNRGERPKRSREAEFYRVLVRTDVLAEPHYTSEPIGSLESGERVLVDARLGHWLRLKPQRGQPGYILAQDATLE
jgi:hypothetical protein